MCWVGGVLGARGVRREPRVEEMGERRYCASVVRYSRVELTDKPGKYKNTGLA